MKTKNCNSYNVTVVKALAQKHKVTEIYVRRCLKGDPKSLAADNIRKDYDPLMKEVETLIKNQQS